MEIPPSAPGATGPLPAAQASTTPHRVLLAQRIAAFFRQHAPCDPGDRILVAFSGGPDSLALALGLRAWAARRSLEIFLLHLDHGLDGDSAARAEAAAALAGQLGLPCFRQAVDVPARREAGESAEAAARRARYEVLEGRARELGARWIATGHHRDDQAETVAMRLLYGSGLFGLAAMLPRRDLLVRPLLGESRAFLASVVREAGLRPVQDPTNAHLEVPRNRIRHRLLPRLGGEAATRLAALATTAAQLRQALEPSLLVGLRAAIEGEQAIFDRRAAARLPEPLLELALAAIHGRVGLHYPARAACVAELRRQLERAGRVGCDCGDGWRWQSRGAKAIVLRRPKPPTAEFSYRLEVPGEVRLLEVDVSVRMSRGEGSVFKFDETATRVAITLPPLVGTEVTIRNRRPGDRIRPAGHRKGKRLKEILIDRKVPRDQRDRLPLLCIGQQIVWVPGVTIDERMRPKETESFWVAEVRER